MSTDTGDLLIRSTGLHLRVKRDETAAQHVSDPPTSPRLYTHTSAPAAGEELQTIRLAAGGRGAGLEALRQRSQSTSHRRQVKVKLLRSHDAPVGITAAAQDNTPYDGAGVAQDYGSQDATGPTQSRDMERVTELTESVRKLLLQCRGQTLTEETLHRLETLHNQQLTLQNQLLDSALRLALRPQALPPAVAAMETLPCHQGGAIDSVSDADRSTVVVNRPEETRLRPEQVLMEMERLRTELKSVLMQREEEEGHPEPRPSQPCLNHTRPRPSRSFQGQTRPHSVPLQSDHGLDYTSRLHLKKSRNPPMTLTNARKQQMKQLRDEETTKKHINISINQKREGGEDTPLQEQDNYIQYLQSKIKSKHNDFQKLQNEVGTEEKSSKESDCEGDETWRAGRAEEQPDQPKEQKNHDLGDSQGKENIICSKPGVTLGSESSGGPTSGLQHARTSTGLVQDLGPLEGVTRCPWTLAGLAQGLGSSGLPTSGLQGSRALLICPDCPDSVLDQARLVLKKVQRRKKILEENLESQLRARSEELLLCHINALEQNRDCSNEIRIKKTVDSFIRDIKAEMELQPERTKASTKKNTSLKREPSLSATRSTANSRDHASSAKRNTAQRRNPLPSTNRNAPERRNPIPSARPLKTTSKAIRQPTDLVLDSVPDPVLDSEELLRHVYGKAAHEGQRRSLKRSPYLRLNSPMSPDRHRPRPQVLQSVRGVKFKSCKTQTPGPGPGPIPGFNPSPCLVVSPGSVHSGAGAGFPAVAIPLGRPRSGTSQTATQGHIVTSPPTAPPPTPPPQEITSPPRAPSPPSSPPQEVTPEDAKAEQTSDPPVVHILHSLPQQEQEEVEFPGMHFLSMADVEQSEAGSEASPDDGADQALELEGGPSPDLVEYQGPQFPPQAPSLPSVQDQSLNLSCELQRDLLEQRLVQWVEQQLMSRIICDMLRPPLYDPTHSFYNSQSEVQQRPEPTHMVPMVQSEPSAATALSHGDSGLQLHVESGLDLDPAQVQGLVLEVLTEIVALFLGSRESPDPQTEPDPGTAPGQGAESGPTQETLVSTPEPTPPSTPPPKVQTLPPAAQSLHLSPVVTPIATPPLTDCPSIKEDKPLELVATPPPTPPLTCPAAEPLLVEELEAPPPHKLSPTHLSVAPPPAPPSPPDSTSSSVLSSSETSITAPRHISEGEILLSQRHLQALHEENSSFSSSLHELQEMDLDPPSEGQINNSILLNFINKLQQREPRPPPEGSWGRDLEEEVSAGEIRDVIHENLTDQNGSPGQTSAITDFLEQTNQSALSEGLLTSDLLDTPPAQVHAPVSAPKQSSNLGLDVDCGPSQIHQTQRTQDSAPDLNLDLEKPENDEGGAEGAVWGEGSADLVKMEVYVPMVETAETSGGSDSFSDAF